MESRRSNQEQFTLMVEFMESNGDLTRPQQGPQGRLRSDQLWQQLAGLLNSCGGGVNKPAEKWKKVWVDWKTKTKRKAMLIRCHVHGTGGGPSSRQTLNALEVRVLGIMVLSAVEGQGDVAERGFDVRSSQLSQSQDPIAGGSTSSPQIEFILDSEHQVPVLTPPPPPPAHTLLP